MKFTDRNGNLINDVLVVTGSGVFNVNGGSSATIHSWSQVQQMFMNKYGVKPTTKHCVVANYMNGDGSANTLHVESPTFMNDQYYAVFNGTGSNQVPIRINYQYTYEISNGVE